MKGIQRAWSMLRCRMSGVVAMMLATETVAQAHRDATTASVQQIAEELQGLLTRRLTAVLAAVKDGKTVTRWATGETLDIRYESEQRLRAAYEIMRLLLQFDAPETVRAWFVGLNPELNDISPVEALRAGQLREALSAARAFIASG
jgi:hypothetical protein